MVEKDRMIRKTILNVLLSKQIPSIELILLHIEVFNIKLRYSL